MPTTLATYWLAIPLFALGISLAVVFFFLRRRRRQQDALHLRLLAGQEQLWGEAIERSMEGLRSWDQTAFQKQRQQAEEALDQLHLILIERQAHLLNFADLVHLQQCKLQVLAADRTAPDRPSAPPSSEPPPPAASPAPALDRGQLEDQLRAKISQLHPGQQPRNRRR